MSNPAPSTSLTPTTQTASITSTITTTQPTPGQRTRRQAGLFFGGVAFVAFSSIITRRALARRYKALPTTPSLPLSATRGGAPRKPPANIGYASASVDTAATTITTVNPTSAQLASSGAAATTGTTTAAEEAIQGHGPILAVEALVLATLNVFSWAVMVTGGALWYFDIASMEDMRRKIRGGLGVDGSGRTEQEAEEEMEEWLATVLARKEEKRERKEGLAEVWRNERGKER